MDTTVSGVGVLDKAAGVLAVLERGPLALPALAVSYTHLTLPTKRIV